MNAANPFHLLLAALALSALPLFAGVATSYVKVSVVLGLLRSAFGVQQMPGNIAVAGLSLTLTALVMGGVFTETARRVATLSVATPAEQSAAQMLIRLGELLEPWRDFLAAHCGARELTVLRDVAAEADGSVAPPVIPGETPRAMPLRIVLPAFLLTELRQAFVMGFAVLLPFLVIDLVTANILVGMGMTMVSPMMVSLPLKVILFVMADGWLMLARGIVSSYVLSR